MITIKGFNLEIQQFPAGESKIKILLNDREYLNLKYTDNEKFLRIINDKEKIFQ